MIERWSSGVYTVTFVGSDFSGTNGGNVQVTPYLDNTNCVVNSWRSNTVDINCFDSSGTATDSRYSVIFYDAR